MAKQSYIGLDIGHDRLKIAWIKNGVIQYAGSEVLPENVIKEGRVVSPETLSEVIKTAIKEHGIKEKNAAFILSADSCYVKNVTIPVMTAEQLMINLPYEFRDYFVEELHDYVYDYAMLSTTEQMQAENEDGGNSMDLIAVAVKKEVLADLKYLGQKCGLKIEIIAPLQSAYMNLISYCEKNGFEKDEEYCFLDFGYNRIRLNIYKGRTNTANRELERGMEVLDTVVSDMKNVDKHLAHTYVVSNFENVLNSDRVIETYNSFAVDVMRSLNFYQFSNQGSNLHNVYVCGAGSSNPTLMRIMRETISDYDFHDVAELLPKSSMELITLNESVLAISIALV